MSHSHHRHLRAAAAAAATATTAAGALTTHCGIVSTSLYQYVRVHRERESRHLISVMTMTKIFSSGKKERQAEAHREGARTAGEQYTKKIL